MQLLIKHIFFIGLIFFCFTACGEVVPRKPISYKTNTFYKKSAKRNRTILGIEAQTIKTAIKKDTALQYLNSEYGFWYAYEIKKSEKLPLPVEDDEVQLRYEVFSINNEPIYSMKDIGLVSYLVNRQDIMFSGLKNLIPLMREGEQVLVYFPSSIAYGYRGDRNKIGVNQSLKCRVYLEKLITK